MRYEGLGSKLHNGGYIGYYVGTIWLVKGMQRV